jgi:cobaltochelatase CobT
MMADSISSQDRPPRQVPDQESLRRANTAWVRTIAGSGPEERFPDSLLKPGPVQVIRARADREAFWSRYHDPVCHESLLPADPGRRLILTALERGRVWAVGSEVFPGAGKNLTEVFGKQSSALSPSEKLERLAFIRLARESSGRFPVRPNSRLEIPFKALSGLWKSLMVADQGAFGRKVLAFLDASPEAGALAGRLVTGEALSSKAEPIQGLALQGALFQQEEDALEGTPVSAGGEKGNLTGRTGRDLGNGYRAYTTAFDRTVPAEALFSPDEITICHQRLERESIPYRRAVTRLARRLMRRLMAMQRRAWVFDQEEGVLNPRRLAGLAADPMNRNIFMQEAETPFPATVVSLLIDNSGSMKGLPIRMAALTTGILAVALERCGVKTEILGYTTRAWKGGRTCESWQADGSPSNPGRINELLHILYKGADSPWRRARRHLGVMSHPDLLKENLDGEALHWAWCRLLARPESRRILLVICDGDPYDEATLAANGPDYLDRHLRSVIEDIERSPVRLAAIGIGHPVGRFYRRAVFLERMDVLAETLVHELLQLLAAP